MRKVFIIGIGAGNPDYITVQAINALNEVDVFFVMDKGREKEDLIRLRKDICERYITDRSYRTIQIRDPERDRTSSSYESSVKAWHEQRVTVYERLIGQELGEEECGAFLVWGDPSFYDSTLRIVDQIIARGTIAFEYEVVPGISSIQALAARHRITLNRIGQSIHITTGRKISEGLPDNIDDVIVMLDAECSFKNVNDPEIEIYWGAYIGTEDEILVSGNLKRLMHDIERIRREAKEKKGWIMDTYLLKEDRGTLRLRFRRRSGAPRLQCYRSIWPAVSSVAGCCKRAKMRQWSPGRYCGRSTATAAGSIIRTWDCLRPKENPAPDEQHCSFGSIVGSPPSSARFGKPSFFHRSPEWRMADFRSNVTFIATF
ncbi:MAG: precorrin-6A synthase (deacetylating) [Alphaproteobacteria bacterium]|nr:MAG: precorrin-6A synthase (deacetylating) [Alphaproteobacteria bacterium]